jgi:hypothetical protein
MGSLKSSGFCEHAGIVVAPQHSQVSEDVGAKAPPDALQRFKTLQFHTSNKIFEALKRGALHSIAEGRCGGSELFWASIQGLAESALPKWSADMCRYGPHQTWPVQEVATRLFLNQIILIHWMWKTIQHTPSLDSVLCCGCGACLLALPFSCASVVGFSCLYIMRHFSSVHVVM